MNSLLSQEQIKKNVGTFAVDLVENGMRLGVGSGTTMYFFIEELGRRVSGGLNIGTVPTSAGTGEHCKRLGIPVFTLDEIDQLDLTVDGADEIDPGWRLIKGGGGALLQEKIVAFNSSQLVIIADQSKLVKELGAFPLPVEVIPFGSRQVAEKIRQIESCRKVTRRGGNHTPFISDHQHYILDCEFDGIPDPETLDQMLHSIPGVVETGLFAEMTSAVIIGYEDGRVEQLAR